MSTLDEAEAFLRELAERTATQSVSTSLVRASRALRQQVDDTDDKRSVRRRQKARERQSRRRERLRGGRVVAHLECNEVDLGFALAAEGLIDAHRDDDPVRPLVLGPRHRLGGRSYAPSERGPHSGPVPKASALRGKRRNRTLREEPPTLCENIEHDYPESERKPEYDVAQQGSRAPSIATEHTFRRDRR